MRDEDVSRLADLIVSAVGTRNLLNIGDTNNRLVPALWRRGADVHDQSSKGRSALPLPASHGAFEAVVFEADPAETDDDTVLSIVRELLRLSSRYVFLWLWCPPELGEENANARRLWWERHAFDSGLRKHPAYYRVNDYQALNRDGPLVCIPLEKLPADAIAEYPLEALAAERGLHMDMLRDPGERSDAHVMRYDWACRYIKPGDRVLDAACGLGYGSHVISHLTDAASVTGMDGSDSAVTYARLCYGDTGRTTFESGLLPQALAQFADASFDAIVSFETLEHVEDPVAVLREFGRLLSPGGRLVVSVPNDWSDETGQDPNPYHLHVYDWTRLRREIEADFLLDEAFAQTASQCKVREQGNVWVRRSRELRGVPILDDAPADCEWWLMSAMKSPSGRTPAYEERVFANIAGAPHPSIQYAAHFANPWLMHAMVNVTYRLRNGAALEDLANRVMVSAPTDSTDYAAALCVMAYRVLDRAAENLDEVNDVLDLISAAAARPPAGPMGLRWKVSLLFVRARLEQAIGHLAQARESYEACAGHDVRPFGIHLSTRITESWFLAGKLAYSCGDTDGALRNWQSGTAYGDVLLSTSLDEILIEPAFPNRFNHGDGVREYTVAWDNIARCANGLHLLRRGGAIDDVALENSFQTEYSTVLRELLTAREHLADRDQELVALRGLLVERTERLEQAAAAVHDRTDDLIATRKALTERTAQAESINLDLRERTDELVATRALLQERSRLLDSALAGLPHAAQELVAAREQLVDRTSRLEVAAGVLVERTRELEMTRAELQDRTARLEALYGELDRRNADVVAAREGAAAARREFEESQRGLKSRAVELERANKNLAEKTGQFQAASFQLHHRNKELEETRHALEERTRHADALAQDLEARTRELVEMRQALAKQNDALQEIRHAPLRHALRRLFGKD